MIKMAIVTGVFVAAGYWFIMSAISNIALGQVENYQKQYEQAIALTEQIGVSDTPKNR
jgi:hypothetical protein